MKKNKSLRLASVLLMLCLITTCAVSGTFAKYTTSATATDTARVAKWGVTTSVTAGELSYRYAKNSTTEIEYTVQSSDDSTKLVAPGTTGKILTAALNGQPEVAAKITITVDLQLNGWEEGGAFCPLIITVDGTEYKVDNSTIDNAAKLESAVEAAIINRLMATVKITTDAGVSKGVKEYAPNDKLDVDDGICPVSWNWEFGANDANDTILGNLGNAPIVQLSITTLIEQID